MAGHGNSGKFTGGCTFVETIQKRQGYMVACLEEIALKNSWVSRAFVRRRAEQMPKIYSVSTY